MKSILLAIALCVSTFSIASAQVFGDATAPEKVQSNQQVEVKVKTDAKFVSIRARKSLFEVAKVYELDNGARILVDNSTDLAQLKDTIKKSDRAYVFTGPDGKYLIDIIYFDPLNGIKEESITVVIGNDTPTPPPPDNSLPKVTIPIIESSVEEGKDTFTITARLDKITNKEVIITPKFYGTANLLKDYTVNPLGCCISIPPGQLTGSLTLTPVSDNEAEGQESVIFSVDHILNAAPGDETSRPQKWTLVGLIKDASGPVPPPPPPVDSIEAQINKAFLAIPENLRNEMIAVRQVDGNTSQMKASLAIAKQYKDIAAEAKKNPNAWDVATMADESRVRVGGVIPSKSLNGWLPFFNDLTKLQKNLDPTKLNDWIVFFEKVNGVLSGELK